jgi:hypothetical protein
MTEGSAVIYNNTWVQLYGTGCIVDMYFIMDDGVPIIVTTTTTITRPIH